MIAKLTGILDSVTLCATKPSGEAILDVGGVGYRVICPARTLASLPEPGAEASLAIETEVREDHIHLYGFGSAVERDCFNLLTTVNGVGAKAALAILGILSPGEVVAAIACADARTLARAPGVGPRLAQRIVGELAGKAQRIEVTDAMPAAATGASVGDAVSALVNLGYRRPVAVASIARAMERAGREASVDALIRAGLQDIADRR